MIARNFSQGSDSLRGLGAACDAPNSGTGGLVFLGEICGGRTLVPHPGDLSAAEGPFAEGGVDSVVPCRAPLRQHLAWVAGCIFPAIAVGLGGAKGGGRCGLPCGGGVMTAPVAARPLGPAAAWSPKVAAAVALRCSCCGLGGIRGSLEAAVTASGDLAGGEDASAVVVPGSAFAAGGLCPFAAAAVCAQMSIWQAPGACLARGCPGLAFTPVALGLRSIGNTKGTDPDASAEVATAAGRAATGEGSAGIAVLGCAAGVATIPVTGKVPLRRIASSNPPGLSAGVLGPAASACLHNDRRAR